MYLFQPARWLFQLGTCGVVCSGLPHAAGHQDCSVALAFSTYNTVVCFLLVSLSTTYQAKKTAAVVSNP